MEVKVIQITSTRDADGDPVLYALCNDGSIWRRAWGGIWEQVEDVPR